jgi:hypothetical protein
MFSEFRESEMMRASSYTVKALYSYYCLFIIIVISVHTAASSS